MVTTVHSLHKRTLRCLPALTQGECCDLKIISGDRRWWLCRMPRGATNHRIIIEEYNRTQDAWNVASVLIDEEQQ